ncbi:MAG: SIMPL domain-containing protein [Eubacterium sp.]|nr:SIMPL domain-containing protein [Eubacterium sp.]
MSNRVIRVTGKGQIMTHPDMTRITITLQGVMPEYDATLEASADDTESLKSIMERMGFTRTDLKTLSFNVDTEHESYRDKNDNWKSRFVGYRYRHTLKVEFPSDNKRLGKILYALANDNTIHPEFRFSFFVKDVEAAKNELLGKAVIDAKAKAEILASAAGVKLSDILSIDYSWGVVDLEVKTMGLDIEEAECCVNESMAYDIDIEPDDIEMNDTVTVVWGIA